MKIREISAKTYEKFSQKEGSAHIAGDYGLEKILRIIDTFKIDRVLEIGLGIGSISDAILNMSASQNRKIKYVGTEANAFCLKVLPENVDNFNQIEMYESINSITTKEVFDFIIIDGSDSSLEQVKQFCSDKALIFIEGGRASQVNLIQKIFPKSYSAEIISYRKPPKHGPFQQKWAGGGSLIATNPSMQQKLFIFTEKVRTFTKRRLRKFV